MERFDQIRRGLDAGFIAVDEASRQFSDDGSAVCRPLFNFPFPDTEKVGDVIPRLPRFPCKAGKELIGISSP